MPYVLIPLLLQVACIVHAVRTGRDRMWIYMLAILPGIGVLAYFAAEILPGLFGSRTAHQLGAKAVRTLNPGRDLRRRYEALEEADTVENRRFLAEELAAQKQFSEAVELYRGMVTGIHADDPALLLGWARAAYGAELYEEALQTIVRLGEMNPNYHAAEAQLFYAMTLEALGRDKEAAREYKQLVTHAPGEEVRCRYAMLLRRQGDELRAKSLFSDVIARAKRAPGHYRRRERHWIDLARREAAR